MPHATATAGCAAALRFNDGETTTPNPIRLRGGGCLFVYRADCSNFPRCCFSFFFVEGSASNSPLAVTRKKRLPMWKQSREPCKAKAEGNARWDTIYRGYRTILSLFPSLKIKPSPYPYASLLCLQPAPPPYYFLDSPSLLLFPGYFALRSLSPTLPPPLLSLAPCLVFTSLSPQHPPVSVSFSTP